MRQKHSAKYRKKSDSRRESDKIKKLHRELILSAGISSLLNFFYNGLHIFRERGFDPHDFLPDRMGKFQTAAVESLTVHGVIFRVIQKISQQRVPDVLHVNPDLMGTPCFEG